MSQTREFRDRGRSMVVTESGTTGGPDYVLVHGIGMGHRYWSDLADTLAKNGRVYALDLPGFGDSPEPDEPLDMEQSGDFLAAFIDSAGIAPAVLIGHSMGSQIVTEAAARHPLCASRVVLIAPTVNPRERTATKQALRLMQDVSLAKPQVMALGLFYYVKAGPRWYFKKLATMLKHRVELSYPRVQAPTLVIRGERDALVPRAWAEQVVTLLPHGRLVEVPGRGHETMITAGARVAQLIEWHGALASGEWRADAELPPLQ